MSKMRSKRFSRLVWVSSLFAAAVLCAAAHAEEVSPTRDWSALDVTSSDEAYAQALQEERAGRGPGRGMFLVDAVMPGCSFIIIVGRPRDPVRISVIATVTGRRGLRYDRPTAVSPGEYYVLALRCEGGSKIRTFNGPHAKFQVRRGELVDVGTLDFQHRTDSTGFLVSTGTSIRSVKPANPEKIAALKSRFPRLMGMMVSRPMTLIGPAEVKTRSR